MGRCKRVALQRLAAYENAMSAAQIVQLLITLSGIALAVVVFLFGPYGVVVNGLIAFVIFVLAGMAAAIAYARLAKKG